MKNVIKNRLGIWDWATEIEPGIYLSALPLREMGFHDEHISEALIVLNLNIKIVTTDAAKELPIGLIRCRELNSAASGFNVRKTKTKIMAKFWF